MEQKKRQLYNCDRCGFTYKKNVLKKQRGMLLCNPCLDSLPLDLDPLHVKWRSPRSNSTSVAPVTSPTIFTITSAGITSLNRSQNFLREGTRNNFVMNVVSAVTAPTYALNSSFDGTNGDTAYSDPIKGAASFAGAAHLDGTNAVEGATSLALNGVSDYITYPNSSDWSFTGDFTIDCWVYFKDITSKPQRSIVAQRDGASSRWDVRLNRDPVSRWTIRGVTATDAISASFSDPTIAINTWYHIAFVRSGTTFYAFRDGVSLIGTANVSPFVFPVCSSVLYVGYEGSDLTSSSIDGNIDSLHILNGTARWTSNFDPLNPDANANVVVSTIAAAQHGTILTLVGTSDTPPVIFTSSNTLLLVSPIALKSGTILTVVYDAAAGVWRETSRS